MTRNDVPLNAGSIDESRPSSDLDLVYFGNTFLITLLIINKSYSHSTGRMKSGTSHATVFVWKYVIIVANVLFDRIFHEHAAEGSQFSGNSLD